MVSDVCRGTDNYLVPIFVREGVIFLPYGPVNRIFMFLKQERLRNVLLHAKTLAIDGNQTKSLSRSDEYVS